jgi:(2R)-3-sulfolactate dehydrogenase (NADP+)
MSESHLTLEEIEALAVRALRGAGAGETAAASLARGIAAAERDGIRSHGLMYLPTYCEHLRCGKVKADAAPRLERPKPGALSVDADTGFAHPAIDLGFAELVPAARELGCAALAVRESYNCGVLGYHTERLARDGLLGLGFTNAPASIAPPGGKTPVIGTNPFSLAVPDGKGGLAFLIDQSASVVAKSEIMLRAREGEAIPSHWALDAEGRPTEDPEAALQGSMAPAGGHKGFGTGLLVETLAAAMSGALLGRDASPFSGTAGGPPRTGQFFLALDPGAFSGAAFGERIAALAEAIAAQDDARLPGDRRLAKRAANGGARIPVAAALLEKIEAYAA